MDYHIYVIPHKSQNYPTVGDYVKTEDGISVKVSKMGNDTYELAVGLHELIEQHLCTLEGISFKEIDSFDIAYEKARSTQPDNVLNRVSGIAPCGCPIQDEPGNDIHAPYHNQHVFATKLEREFMDEAGWAKYDKTVNEL